MFRIPDDEPEPLVLVPVQQSVPVVSSPVVAEPTDRGIQVSAVEDHQQVVDEIDRVEQPPGIGIATAVGLHANHLAIRIQVAQIALRKVIET